MHKKGWWIFECKFRNRKQRNIVNTSVKFLRIQRVITWHCFLQCGFCPITEIWKIDPLHKRLAKSKENIRWF